MSLRGKHRNNTPQQAGSTWQTVEDLDKYIKSGKAYDGQIATVTSQKTAYIITKAGSEFYKIPIGSLSFTGSNSDPTFKVNAQQGSGTIRTNSSDSLGIVGSVQDLIESVYDGSTKDVTIKHKKIGIAGTSGGDLVASVTTDEYGHISSYNTVSLEDLGLNFGTDGQIPYMNADGDAFIYTNSPTIDSSDGTMTILGDLLVENSTDYAQIWNATNGSLIDLYANSTLTARIRSYAVDNVQAYFTEGGIAVGGSTRAAATSFISHSSSEANHFLSNIYIGATDTSESYISAAGNALFQGTVTVGNAYTLPATAGTESQVLAFPASGNELEWKGVALASGTDGQMPYMNATDDGFIFTNAPTVDSSDGTMTLFGDLMITENSSVITMQSTGGEYGYSIISNVNTTTDAGFQIRDLDSNILFRIDTGGAGDPNVGIGSNNPNTMLHLYGVAPTMKIEDSANGIVGSIGNANNVVTGGTGGHLGINANTAFRVGIGGALAFSVNSLGNGIFENDLDVNGDTYLNGNVYVDSGGTSTLLTVKSSGSTDSSAYPEMRLYNTRNGTFSEIGDILGRLTLDSDDGSGAGAGLRGAIDFVTGNTTGSHAGISFKVRDTDTTNLKEAMYLRGSDQRTELYGDLYIDTATPTIIFYENDNTGTEWHVRSGGTAFNIRNDSTSTNVLTLNSGGNATFSNNVLATGHLYTTQAVDVASDTIGSLAVDTTGTNTVGALTMQAGSSTRWWVGITDINSSTYDNMLTFHRGSNYDEIDTNDPELVVRAATGIGVFKAPSYALDVHGNGYFETIGDAADAVVYIDSDSGETARLRFREAGTTKWDIGRTTGNSLTFYSSTLAYSPLYIEEDSDVWMQLDGTNSNEIQFTSSTTTQANIIFYTNDTARFNLYATTTQFHLRRTGTNATNLISLSYTNDTVAFHDSAYTFPTVAAAGENYAMVDTGGDGTMTWEPVLIADGGAGEVAHMNGTADGIDYVSTFKYDGTDVFVPSLRINNAYTFPTGSPTVGNVLYADSTSTLAFRDAITSISVTSSDSTVSGSGTYTASSGAISLNLSATDGGSGESITYGTDHQVPFMTGTSGFQYSSALVFDDTYSQLSLSKSFHSNSTRKSYGALKFTASSGQMLFDNGLKRISWNDGAGNFNIRAGNYTDYSSGSANEVFTSNNGGAANLEMDTDSGNGLMYLQVQKDSGSSGADADLGTWATSITISSSDGAGVNQFSISKDGAAMFTISHGDDVADFNMDVQTDGIFKIDGGNTSDEWDEAYDNYITSAQVSGGVITFTQNNGGTFNSHGSLGTVTSVAMTVPTGLTVSGSPITQSGTFVIGLDTDRVIVTTTEVDAWDEAVSWGNHSTVGYLTSYTETDPVFTASVAYSITSSDISDWDSAYTYSQVGHLPLAGGTVTGNLGVGGDLTLTGSLIGDSTATATTIAGGDSTSDGGRVTLWGSTNSTYAGAISLYSSPSDGTDWHTFWDASGNVEFTGTITTDNLTTAPDTLLGSSSGTLGSLTLGTGFAISGGQLQYTEQNTGSVTSVGFTAPTAGFSVTGSPVTSSGTIELEFASGYSLPTDASQTTWDTAYTYSQVGHLPLSGGTVTDDVTIATSSANANLYINNNGTGYAAIYFGDSTDSTEGFIRYNASSSQIEIRGGNTGSSDLTIVDGGAATFSDNLTVTGGLYVSQYIYHSGDTTTRLDFTTSQIDIQAGGVVGFRANATEVSINTGNVIDTAINAGNIYVDASTNRVGIGDTTPSYKLDVAGDIYSQGTIRSVNHLTSAEWETAYDRSITGMSYSSGTLTLSRQDGGSYSVTTVTTGTGTSGQVAYWSGNNTLTSDGNFTWTGSAMEIAGTLTIDGSSAQSLILQSTGTTGNVYMRFQDSAGTRKGYVGYGSQNNDYLNLYNQTDTGGIYLGTTNGIGMQIEGNLSNTIYGVSTTLDSGSATTKSVNVQYNSTTSLQLQANGSGSVLSMWDDTGGSRNNLLRGYGDNEFNLITGDFGIGRTPTTYKLEVAGDIQSTTGLFRRDSADYISVGDTYTSFYHDGAEEMRIDTSGILYVRSNIIGYSTVITSDARFKDVKDTYDDQFTKELQGQMFDDMIGARWNWKDRDGHQSGVIAQTIQKYMPWVVNEIEDNFNGRGSYLGVNYDGLFMPVFNEIGIVRSRLTELETKEQQQDREIEELRAENEELKRRLDELS